MLSMQKQICVVCGNVAVAKGFCEKHFRPEMLKLKIDGSLQRCKRCSYIISRGRKFADMNGAVRSMITLSGGAWNCSVQLRENGGKVFAKITASGMEGGLHVKEEVDKLFTVQKTT